MRCFAFFLVSVMAVHNLPIFFCGLDLSCFGNIVPHEELAPYSCSGLMRCGVRSPCKVKKPPELRPCNKLLNRTFQNSSAHCKGFAELCGVEEFSWCLWQGVMVDLQHLERFEPPVNELCGMWGGELASRDMVWVFPALILACCCLALALLQVNLAVMKV